MGNLLKGKVAAVTGAARGIGAAIARRMAAEGAHVAILDIDLAGAEEVAGSIRELGVKAEAFRLDVTDTPSIRPLVDHIAATFGSIDIWVNNAGICKVIPIESLTERDWDLMMNINLKSAFFCSQAVFAIMKKQRFGRIINMSSMAGERGGKFTGANYSASKAGLLGLTKALALNGGEHNITVNAIAPGLIATNMADELGFPQDPAEVALGRLGTAEEVAGAVIFLASDLGAYVSGTTIDVNGAQYMR